MTARQKIENLTHAWYGLDVFVFIAGALMGLSLLAPLRLAALALSFVITWFIGNRLLAKSTFWRACCIVVSVLSMLGGGLTLMRCGWGLLHGISIGLLLEIFVALALFSMNLRAFRTLRDPSVKAYFG